MSCEGGTARGGEGRNTAGVHDTIQEHCMKGQTRQWNVAACKARGGPTDDGWFATHFTWGRFYVTTFNRWQTAVN